MQTNLAGTCSDNRFLKCTLITKQKRPVSTGRFLNSVNDLDTKHQSSDMRQKRAKADMGFEV